MPVSPDTDMDVLEKKCTEVLNHFGSVGKTELRPVAFGLKALIVYLIADEKSGGLDEMEKQLSSIENVNSVNVEDVRRTVEI